MLIKYDKVYMANIILKEAAKIDIVFVKSCCHI